MKRWTGAFILVVVGGLAGTVATRSILQGQPATATAPVAPKELTSFRPVVKAVLPGVVSIEAKGKVPRQPDAGGDALIRRGFGSGVIVDSAGIVLTNYHVVEGADQVTVELHDGRKFTSRDIKGDAKTDLAIVRIESKAKLPALELGDSDEMEIGDRVLAVGAPFGLTGSVTHGIVSGKGRSLRLNMYEDFIQTDAAINPGNSGGPLVNLEGKVIGITSAIKSRSGGFQGVGLAISSNLASDVMKKLLKDGVVRRGYLGIQIADLLDPDAAERLGLKKGQTGVVVTRAFEGAPGAKGGIKEKDVILTIAGQAVRDGRELQRAVAGLPLGKPVRVEILRDGQPKNIDVVIEEQPERIDS